VTALADRLRAALEHEPDLAYAVLFGSAARDALRPDSDVDIAVELRPAARLDREALGALMIRLEAAAERHVDLVLLEDAAPPLAYRIFRDGRVIIERDHAALARRKARAILDYLDFKPVEDRCAEGVLRATARG
jgi:predicted nucleotidyltransferase